MSVSHVVNTTNNLLFGWSRWKRVKILFSHSTTLLFPQHSIRGSITQFGWAFSLMSRWERRRCMSSRPTTQNEGDDICRRNVGVEQKVPRWKPMPSFWTKKCGDVPHCAYFIWRKSYYSSYEYVLYQPLLPDDPIGAMPWWFASISRHSIPGWANSKHFWIGTNLSFWDTIFSQTLTQKLYSRASSSTHLCNPI